LKITEGIFDASQSDITFISFSKRIPRRSVPVQTTKNEVWLVRESQENVVQLKMHYISG
jgi:hypothetical protein